MNRKQQIEASIKNVKWALENRPHEIIDEKKAREQIQKWEEELFSISEQEI